MGFLTAGKRSIPLNKQNKNALAISVKKRKKCLFVVNLPQNTQQYALGLEDLPIDVLHYIFVLAGPANNLPLTSKFCYRIFKFASASNDDGVWPNLDLLVSMIRFHYMTPLNIDERALSDENINQITSHLQSVENKWLGRGDDNEPLKNDAHYKLVVTGLEQLKLQIRLFKMASLALDASILSNKFISSELIDRLLRTNILHSICEPQDSKVLIMTSDRCEQERVLRPRFLLFKANEISFHLSLLEDRINRDEVHEPAREVNAASIEAHDGRFFGGLELLIAEDLKLKSGSEIYRFDEDSATFVYANYSMKQGTPFPKFFFKSGAELVKRLPLLRSLREYGFYLLHVNIALSCLITYFEHDIIRGDVLAATSLNSIVRELTLYMSTFGPRISPDPITNLMTTYHTVSKAKYDELLKENVLSCLKHLIRLFYEPNDFGDDQPLWECARRLKNGVLAPLLFEMCKDSERGYKYMFK